MSVGFGIEVGASVVKVATVDAATTLSAHTFPRRAVFPELVSRVGTRVPHVGRDAGVVAIRLSQDLFVEEARRAIRRITETDPINGSGITLIAPEWWTPRACAAIREALAGLEMHETRLVSSAVAAVRGYQAAGHSIPTTVAVLDLGAYTCSAAVVTDCGTDDIRRIGHPTVVHGRGGADLDARILHHVLDGLRSQGLIYEHDDAEAVEAAHKLLAECRAAKETLSASPVTTLAPHMPGAASQFRLVRAEHDDIARPAVQEVVHMLKDCISASGHHVGAVLLAGGGAPIPIVAQQISVQLGLPVLLDDDPATLAARGAAHDSFTVLSEKPAASRKFARTKGRRALPRPQRKSSERRHRGARATVAAAYVAFALIATGGPAPSVAEPADPSSDLVPTSASHYLETPVALTPDVLPRPPSSELESESGSNYQIGQSSMLQLPPTVTRTTPKAKNKTGGTSGSSTSGSGSGGASSSGSGSTPTPVEPTPTDTPPNDPPPSDPPPDDGTSGGTEGETGGDGQP